MKHYWDAALPEDFALERVQQVMEQRGYRWAQRIAKQELQFAEEIWELPEGRGAVRYVYDHIMEVPTIRAESDRTGEATRILVDLQKDLPLLDVEPLAKQALSSAPAKGYALRAMAAITERYHGSVIKAFTAAISDPDPVIRKLVLVCIGRYPAFFFVKSLEDQAIIEPDPETRQKQLALAADVRMNDRRGTLW